MFWGKSNRESWFALLFKEAEVEFSSKNSSQRFVKRVFYPRLFGYLLALLAIWPIVSDSGISPMQWSLLVFNGLLWPHMARQLASISSSPFKAELRNTAIDAFCLGYWVVVLQFNLITSAALVGMIAMNSVAVLGWRLLVLSLLGVIAGLGLSVLVNGFQFQPQSTLVQCIAVLPLLILYPSYIAYSTYQLAFNLRVKKRALEKVSITDGLTELFNRRHWHSLLEAEFSRLKRSNGQCALMILDIDSFKSINDSYGHLTGDKVIIEVANLINEHTRKQDASGRFGGEEFTIILPDTCVREAQAVAEKIRLLITQVCVKSVPELTISASFGIACFNQGFASTSDWLQKADDALYKAKHSGKNKVCVSSLQPALQS